MDGCKRGREDSFGSGERAVGRERGVPDRRLIQGEIISYSKKNEIGFYFIYYF